HQLAILLRNRNFQDETLVPISMDPGVEMIIGMLGILKAGGAYVPIDPGYPAERIAYMLKDTGATILLTSVKTRSKLKNITGVEIIEIDALDLNVDEEKLSKFEISLKTEQLAYVIYTSGSTGKPKGVMIEHKGISNLVNWHNREYKVSDISRATAMAGFGFDAFGWEVWPYLAAGASVHIVNESSRLSPSALIDFIDKKYISHSFISTALVPDVIASSGSHLKCFKYLLTGGDKLPSIDVGRLSYDVINNYGPTENTVVATNYWLTAKESSAIPPIGKPISNLKVFILSKEQELVPVGVAGEICISGESIARGYLNRADLTSEKFVDFRINGQSSKIYKTGDLGCWLADGNIEYRGRIDDQVQIRGYRIELREIENVLLQSGLVKQAVVLVTGNEVTGERLVAYVLALDKFEKEVAISYLQQRLPEYMIPTGWKTIETMPLTSNGKIDKQALINLENMDLFLTTYIPPRNEVEEKLVKIWQELLKVEKIGIQDNFFELGGHSLLAMRMVSQIERNLSLSVPINVLFQSPTIDGFSKYLYLQDQIGNSLEEKNKTTFRLLDV
ncbi:MAG: amino acid adenylation domain-containing protein, partial [Pyrinomonadaceae bacterium]